MVPPSTIISDGTLTKIAAPSREMMARSTRPKHAAIPTSVVKSTFLSALRRLLDR
jgi:hypothetical protein